MGGPVRQRHGARGQAFVATSAVAEVALTQVVAYGAAAVALVVLGWCTAGASRLFVEAGAEAHEAGYGGVGAGLWRKLRGPVGSLDLVMGVAVVAAGWILVVSVGPAAGVLLAAFVAILLALWRVDAATETLPDLLTQPLVWLGLAASVAPLNWPVPVADAVSGALLGYGVVGGLGALARLRAGAELGEGDAKLAAAIGAWLGIFGSVVALLLAAVAALAWLALGARARRGLSFGPFLAAAGLFVVALLWSVGPLDRIFSLRL